MSSDHLRARDGRWTMPSRCRDTDDATTPYFIAFADLTRMGPIVLDVAAGPSAGSCVRTNVRDTDRHE